MVRLFEKYLLVLFVLVFNFFYCDSVFECRYAELNDIPELLQLLEHEASQESDKIVILPRRFREQSLESAIFKQRLFVAVDSEKSCIVGFKKLFCITDPDELHDILKNELRCTGQAAAQAVLDNVSLVPLSMDIPDFLKQATFIYTGSDFTLPEYRGCGVNSALTRFALNAVSTMVQECMLKNKSLYVALAYGLTMQNAGVDLLDGRTKSILRLFNEFVANLNGASSSLFDYLIVQRFHAFKPTFDPDSDECVPLPESHSEAGYGCILGCPVYLHSLSTSSISLTVAAAIIATVLDYVFAEISGNYGKKV
ncbi:MAG TPA: hypothetical protein VHA52_10655 [Candidatus Babeliaceae bacterium]|nr:hypothetical protein [Candidatus Babeliaceae bacterium]